MVQDYSDVRLPVAAVLLTLTAAALAIGLIALAERIGLHPAAGAAAAAGLIGAMLVVLAVTASTSRVEGLFLAGRQLGTLGGATIVALFGAAFLRLILVGDTPGRLAVLLAAIPIAGAGAVMLRPLLAKSSAATPGGLLRERFGVVVQIPVIAVLGVLAGLLLILAFGHAAAGVSAITGLAPGNTAALVLALAGVCLVSGGARSLIACLMGIGMVCAVGLAMPIVLAASVLGPLPLPDFTEPDMLSAIASTRDRWFGTVRLPAQPVDWSDLPKVFAPASLPVVCGVALTLLCLSLLLPIGRGATTLIGALKREGFAAGLVGASLLATIMIIAYGIDAAAISFIGAPAARPPAGLLEAGRLELAQVCGAPVASAAALRLACGGLPLAAQLSADQVQLLPAYALQGLPVALELPAALALITRLVDVALAFVVMLLAAHLLTGIITQDMARGWLFRRAIVSWQVAMGRLTYALLLIGLAVLPPVPGWITWPIMLVAVAGVTLVLLPLLILSRLPGAGWWTGLACLAGSVTAAWLLAPPISIAPELETVFPPVAFGVLAGCASGLAGRLVAAAIGRIRSRTESSAGDPGLVEAGEPAGAAPNAP